MKNVPPSVTQTAFNCPHCGALARQFWFSALARGMKKDVLPFIIDDAGLNELKLDHMEDASKREEAQRWAARMAKELPFFEGDRTYSDYAVNNIWFSRCFNCEEVALWVYNRMIHPQSGEAPPANPDMPEDIRRDYDEASAILDLSPRGAAALIRLAIQKICKELGKPGRNINDDIGALVKDGLDRRVQQALDAVRVIGNSAVHPGQIDIRDDRAIAEALFRLLNLIVEKMISEPKHVQEVYDTLPTGAIEAIKKRDEEDRKATPASNGGS